MSHNNIHNGWPFIFPIYWLMYYVYVCEKESYKFIPLKVKFLLTMFFFFFQLVRPIYQYSYVKSRCNKLAKNQLWWLGIPIRQTNLDLFKDIYWMSSRKKWHKSFLYKFVLDKKRELENKRFELIIALWDIPAQSNVVA